MGSESKGAGKTKKTQPMTARGGVELKSAKTALPGTSLTSPNKKETKKEKALPLYNPPPPPPLRVRRDEQGVAGDVARPMVTAASCGCPPELSR